MTDSATDNICPIIQERTPYGVFEVYTTTTGISQHSFLEVTQVHSGEVIHCLPSYTSQEISALRADGMVYFQQDFSVTRPNLLIKTADCLPLFLGSKLGWAMLHAGWRGLQQKILQHDLIKKLRPDYVFIGHIYARTAIRLVQNFKNIFPGVRVCK